MLRVTRDRTRRQPLVGRKSTPGRERERDRTHFTSEAVLCQEGRGWPSEQSASVAAGQKLEEEEAILNEPVLVHR
jgi:hypothetical protein